MKTSKNEHRIVGIDEVGRGPVAGPVAVGVVSYAKKDENFLKKNICGVRDSKQLSARKRDIIFSRAREYRRKNLLNFSVAFVGAKVIDDRGIVYAVKTALARALRRVGACPEVCEVLLDGSLCAPEKYNCQRTIIKGDQKEFAISLASVVAKVSRDRKLVRMSKQFPGYGLDTHKGYGTKKHMEIIKKNGLSKIHRKSFLNK